MSWWHHRRELTISQAIFESFEPESSDEENSDADGDIDELTSDTTRLEVHDADHDVDEQDESGTGVLTSQLRHFVIQASPLMSSCSRLILG